MRQSSVRRSGLMRAFRSKVGFLRSLQHGRYGSVVYIRASLSISEADACSFAWTMALKILILSDATFLTGPRCWYLTSFHAALSMFVCRCSLLPATGSIIYMHVYRNTHTHTLCLFCFTQLHRLRSHHGVYLSVCLPISSSIHLSIYLFIYLSIC